MKYFFLCVHLFQRALFYLADALYRILPGRREGAGTWVVGVEEVAGSLGEIAGVINNSVSVCFLLNPYFEHHYDYYIGVRNRPLNSVVRLFYGPLVLARLVNRYRRFYYVGKCGYLMHQWDGRSWEFALLRRRGALIACHFAGSDIRSCARMDALGETLDRDVITTYQRFSHTGIDTPAAEEFKRALAAAADEYASVIFSYPVDQASYLGRDCEPFRYFCPPEKFSRNPEKFADPQRIRILHAPSSPLLKGTPLVRAAIARLKREGYPIDYLELQGVGNDVVMRELRDAHIVLNQFYAFVPGGFGIEALASHTVMLCSADREIETMLPEGANRAWVVTPYWAIYQELKSLLDEPAGLLEQAERGYTWAQTHCACDASARELNRVLDSLERP